MDQENSTSDVSAEDSESILSFQGSSSDLHEGSIEEEPLSLGYPFFHKDPQLKVVRHDLSATCAKSTCLLPCVAPESAREVAVLPKVHQLSNKLMQDEAPEPDHALLQMHKWIQTRKRLQSRLAERLNSTPSSLLMNRFEDDFDLKKEKEEIYRTKFILPPGKTYEDINFFKLPAKIRDKHILGESSICATITDPDRGILPDIEYIKTPKAVQKEQGFSKKTIPRKMWPRSKYLVQRQVELRKELKSVIKHKPDMEELCVVGKAPSKPGTELLSQLLESGKLTIPEIVITRPEAETGCKSRVCESCSEISCGNLDPNHCARLKFNDKFLEWDCNRLKNTEEKNVTLLLELIFETDEGRRCTKDVVFENVGTCAIKFWWVTKIVNPAFPFAKSHKYESPFFFDKNTNVILPGQIQHFEVHFKSDISGIFEAIMILCTEPKLNQNDELQVLLWAVANPLDECKEVREELQKMIGRKTNLDVVKKVVEDIFNFSRPCPPEYPPYPSHFMRKEVFEYRNPGYYYHPNVIDSLNDIYKSAVPESGEEWDLRLSTIREAILKMERGTLQDEFSNILRRSVQILLFPSNMQPPQDRKHYLVYNLLCSLANTITAEGEELQDLFGIKYSSGFLKDKTDKKISPVSTQRKTKRNEKVRSGSRVSASESDDVSGDTSVLQLSLTEALKYEKYRKTLYIKVYHHVAAMVDQIVAVLETLEEENKFHP